jgi:hypothetical protein
MAEKPTISGLQIIREAVAARANLLVIMARDVGCGIGLLEDFSKGRADLPADRIQNIVKFIWNDYVAYNAEADAIMALPQPEARSIGRPPQLTVKLPTYQYGAAQQGGPRPEVPPPKPKQRPGWIGTIWE